jgi:hypothetical protein
MKLGSFSDAKFIHLPNRRTTAFPLALFPIGETETQMKKIKPTAKLPGWVEFCWLLVSNPSFQAARDKRLAFYEYQVGKRYANPCY